MAKDYMLNPVYASDMDEEKQDEAVEAAKDAWDSLHESERRTCRRDKCGTFRVYEVSIPYSDLIGEGEEAHTENPYTEYEEWEWYNALKED